MYGKKKQIMQHLKGIFKIALMAMVVWSCSKSPATTEIHGEAQGTTYTIIVSDEDVVIKKEAIDSILNQFDLYLSLYRKDSYISRVNDNDSYQFVDSFGYFSECYFIAELLHEQSNGLVDPTLYPILNLWKLYSKEGLTKPDMDGERERLLPFVGFNNSDNYQVKFNRDKVNVEKFSPEVKFDFNAIAQGYSADVLAMYLESKGAQNYYVEIGGELVVKGKNPDGKKWRIGIDKPEDSGADDRESDLIVSVSNMGIATSGSYRNFVEVNGQRVAHIFNPKTGEPQPSEIVSVTVFAPTAAMADGYATYFMMLPLTEIKAFYNDNPDVSAIVIYDKKGKWHHESIGNARFVINE